MNKNAVTKILDEYTSQWESMDIRGLDGISTTKVIPAYVMNTAKYVIPDNRKDSMWRNDKKKTGYFYVLDNIQKALPYEDHIDPYGSSVGKIRPEVLRAFLEQEQDNLLKDKRFKSMRDALIFYGIGIDCSGFVSRALGRVMQELNIDMELRWKSLRYNTDSVKQYNPNSTLPFRSNCTILSTSGGVHVDPENAQPGDILYNRNGSAFHVRIVVESLGSNDEESGFVTAEASSYKLRVVRKEWKHLKKSNEMFYRFFGEGEWTKEKDWNKKGIDFEVYRPWAMMDLEDVAKHTYAPKVAVDENGVPFNAKTIVNANFRSGARTSASPVKAVSKGTMFVADIENPVESDSPNKGSLWYRATIDGKTGYFCESTITLLEQSNASTAKITTSSTSTSSTSTATSASSASAVMQTGSTSTATSNKSTGGFLSSILSGAKKATNTVTNSSSAANTSSESRKKTTVQEAVTEEESVVYNAKTSCNANLRKGTTTKDSVVKVVLRGTSFVADRDKPVTSNSPSVGSLWYHAKVGDLEGYFCGTTISFLNEDGTTVAAPKSTGSTDSVSSKSSTSSVFSRLLANAKKNSSSTLSNASTTKTTAASSSPNTSSSANTSSTSSPAVESVVVTVENNAKALTNANLRKGSSTKSSILKVVLRNTLFVVDWDNPETSDTPKPGSLWYKATVGKSKGYLCGSTITQWSKGSGNSSTTSSTSSSSILSRLKSSITNASVSNKAEMKAKAESESNTIAAPVASGNNQSVASSVSSSVQKLTSSAPYQGGKIGNYVSKSDINYIIVATDANLRKGPSTKEAVVGKIPQGTILSIKGAASESNSSPSANSKWYQVTYEGHTGWLCSVTYVADLSPVCTGFVDPDGACAKVIAAFNGDKDARRIFNEVHYYPKDPHITIGFGHFAGGTQDKFIKSMMENGEMRNILVEEFKKCFVARPEFINQACKEGFNLKLDSSGSVIGLETFLSNLKLEGKFGPACRSGKFPGGGKKTGYWLNDILVDVLLNKFICAWQVKFWLDNTLSDAKNYANTLGMAGNYGLVASLASLRSSGLMKASSITPIVTSYSNRKTSQRDRDYAAMAVWLYYNKAKGSTVTRGRQKAIFSSWYSRSWTLKASEKAPKLMSSCTYNGLSMGEAPGGRAFEEDSQGLYIDILHALK